jgi:hypothetical protein
VDEVLRDLNSATPKALGADWTYRMNPKNAATLQRVR